LYIVIYLIQVVYNDWCFCLLESPCSIFDFSYTATSQLIHIPWVKTWPGFQCCHNSAEYYSVVVFTLCNLVHM
jgi:hypothetical protein